MNNLVKAYNDIREIVLSDSFLRNIPSVDRTLAYDIILQSLHEAQWAIRFLSQFDCNGKRVLEIGAGAGIVSACLHLCGAQVTMIEPSSGAFSYHEKICASLHKHLGIQIPCITKPVEEIEPGLPQYDFIFSINVLEHILNLDKAFSVMNYLLKYDGVMFHICPNYTIPYEPHVGVVLVPFFPRATFTLSKRLRTHPVSEQLTFITVSSIKKLAKKNNLTVKFYKDMMYQSFMRLTTDSEFRKRQSGLPATVFKLLQSLGIIHFTKYVPVCLQTPVAFEMRKKF
ncbi:MAG TPA: class I SAM-dependent methyltransferase [Spirochaetota bacterium]|nr:class I SAM-dependent methyltransferase [Spirochaetota bacterium]